MSNLVDDTSTEYGDAEETKRRIMLTAVKFIRENIDDWITMTHEEMSELILFLQEEDNLRTVVEKAREKKFKKQQIIEHIRIHGSP